MDVFIWPIRVYYEDTDASGIVYHANYLKFFERARTEMLRAKGFEQDSLKTNESIIFAIRSITIDYLNIIRFNELIEVNSKIIRIRKASLIFEQAINRDDTLLSKATITVACLDVNTMRPKAIPQTLLVEFQ